jgi:signal transduction histidine kinase/DNA-binding LacI/PurR family transcriptional regulator
MGKLVPAQKERLTLGFLTYYEDGDYHNQMMSGIFAAARKNGANIIHFSGFGRNAGDGKFNQGIQTSLAMIREMKLDGLMFLGWIQNFKETFLKDILDLHIPLFSLGSFYETIPNIYVDGEACFRELLVHLATVHGCRKIAYIAPVHWDKRVKAYQEVMRELGIEESGLFIDATELEHYGVDMVQRGSKAVSILLDNRKTHFDAIASSYNDETLSLIQELKKRGYSVPDDVKVIGYEDDDSSKYAEIPVTTIYYPCWELGFFGCERFIQILATQNSRVPFSTVISGKVILRRSCGCHSNFINFDMAELLNDQKATNPWSEKRDFKGIIDKMHQAFPAPGFDLDHLLRSFFADFEAKTSSQFLTALEEQLLVYYPQHQEVSGVENVISFFYQQLQDWIADQKPEILWVEAIFRQAGTVISKQEALLMGRQKIINRTLNDKLNKINQELMTAFQIRKVMNALESNLPGIQVPSCYLYLYDPVKASMETARLAFQYLDNRRIEPEAATPRFLKNVMQLLPHNRIFSLLAYPLSVDEECLGLVFFEPGPLDERIYFTLAVLLSTALEEALLVEKLENTNRELKAAERELVDKAHKAGMADIATGTLHNIGNVLNSINTSIHVLKDMVRDSPLRDFERANDILSQNMDQIDNFIIQDPRGKKLLKFYLKLEQPFHQLHQLMNGHLDRLVERINLVNEIIRAQQDYAGARAVVETLDITDIIEDALKLQSSMLQKYKIQVITEIHPVPKRVLQRTKLLHILVNVFNNARDAMKETPEDQRTLTIRLHADEHTIYLQICDTGHGIPPEFLNSIFGQGFTTKSDGHGFGLHSCANYMTEMGGKIRAESQGPGRGATFILEFTL